MINSKSKLIDIYRKSQNNKDVLNPIFNQNNGCFSCMIVSEMTLEDACKLKNVDLNFILSQLN